MTEDDDKIIMQVFVTRDLNEGLFQVVTPEGADTGLTFEEASSMAQRIAASGYYI